MYRYLRQEMDNNEAMIHVEFAENYVARLSSAIQSSHFGAFQMQIILHTGVYYVGPYGVPHILHSLRLVASWTASNLDLFETSFG